MVFTLSLQMYREEQEADELLSSGEDSLPKFQDEFLIHWLVIYFILLLNYHLIIYHYFLWAINIELRGNLIRIDFSEELRSFIRSFT